MGSTHVRTRIAPSPTGIPHIGNTRTALFDYLLAKKYNGEFILRIEDTDQDRYVPGSEEKIFRIQDVLGLIPDESPQVGGPFAPYTQSERKEIYQKYAKELVAKGAAYYCFCTEERLKKLHEDNPFAKYDRLCRNLSPSEVDEKLNAQQPHVIRVKLPETGFTVWKDLVQGKLSLPNNECDDKVLLKTSGLPTYHLAVVVDDHLMEISHALRGVEWMMSTPVHLFLYESFGWEPPILAHVPLLLGPDKSKLSKRHGAKSVLEYIDDGYLPEAINNFLFFLGFSYKDNSDLLTLAEMIDIFDENRIQRQNAIFDIEKLNYLNSQWIKKMSDSDLYDRIRPSLPEDWQKEKVYQVLPLVKDRMVTLKDFAPLSDFFFTSPSFDKGSILDQSAHTEEETKKWFTNVIAVISSQTDFIAQSLHEKLAQIQKDSGLSPKEAFMSLRLSLTGRPVTPPLFDCIVVLGKEESIRRLNQFLS